MYAFPDRLRQLRADSGLTQKQLAIEVGSSERGLQDYELHKRKPGHDVIIKLCRYFNVSADYLLGLSDEPTAHRKEEPHGQ